MAKTSWQKVFVAKKFREIFFENNTIHLHGKIFVAKKFSWQKIFVAKNFRSKNFALLKIEFTRKFSNTVGVRAELGVNPEVWS